MNQMRNNVWGGRVKSLTLIDGYVQAPVSHWSKCFQAEWPSLAAAGWWWRNSLCTKLDGGGGALAQRFRQILICHDGEMYKMESTIFYATSLISKHDIVKIWISQSGFWTWNLKLNLNWSGRLYLFGHWVQWNLKGEVSLLKRCFFQKIDRFDKSFSNH